MAYEEIKSHGVTSDTPKNILLGAGTIHKGLTFGTGVWNFAESLIGATSGGTKLTFKPELKDIELDGVMVRTKGLVIKIGETAVLETSLGELTPEILKMAILGSSEASETMVGYDVLKSKADIAEGDYITNLAYVGKTLDGRPIVVIFGNALCTSGLEIEGKNKENSIIKLTFECYADLTGDLTVLPFSVFYPTPVVIP